MPVIQAEIKKIKALHTKKGRSEQKRFLAEGVRLLHEALKWRVYPEVIIFAPDMLAGDADLLIRQFRERNVQVEEVTSRRMKSITDTVNSQGMLGVFEIPEYSPGKLLSEKPRKVLMCNGIADPGNLGTLIRSAAAFGFQTVLVDETGAEPYNPKVIRSTAGANFAIKVARWPLEKILTFLEDENYYMIGADVNGEEIRPDDIADHERAKFALVIGSEATGLSSNVREKCRSLWKIGHLERVESLNAAVAGSILMKNMYEW